MYSSDQMRLSPWIETLILRYDLRDEEQEEQEEQGGGGGMTLMAHVTGVGNMPASQASASGDPSVLLFLSDGAVQIPAVLSSSAWERLQEEEERETFSGLLYSTVALRSFALRFHPAPEKTRCRFYLSIRELSTSSVGSSRTAAPCCSSLPSVRAHLHRTYQALQVRGAPHRSHTTFDLSELLEEWENDHLQGVFNGILNKIRKILTTSTTTDSPQPSTSTFTTTTDSPQPSTSTHSAPLSHGTTTWDLDRVRYKDERVFMVPVRYLLIPEEEDLQADTRGSEPSGSVQPSVGDADWRISDNIPAERVCRPHQTSPPPEEEEEEENILQEGTSSGLTDRPLSNPWNVFPPPCVTSDSSPDSPPTQPLHHCATTESTVGPPNTKLTSTQLHSSKETSFLPPSGQTASSSSSKPDSEEHSLPEGVETRGRKRKHSQDSPEVEAVGTIQEEEEEENSGSPPSWLFNSQAGGSGVEGSGVEGSGVEGSGVEGSGTEGSGVEGSSTGCNSSKETVPRKFPRVHSDGSPFSYSYQVSGSNLEDFAAFRVPQSLLQWAVKFLIAPKRTDDPPNAPQVTSLRVEGQISEDK